MEEYVQNDEQCVTTVSVNKESNDDCAIVKTLLDTKVSLSTNRDGITIGSNIYCDVNGILHTATATKNGYSYNNTEYLNITDITNEVFGKSVYVNPLKLWYLDDNKTIYEHLQEVLS